MKPHLVHFVLPSVDCSGDIPVPSSLGSVKEVEIPKHVVGLKRTWDQMLSSGLLLTFMPVQPLPVPLRGCCSILTTKRDS